MKVLINMANLRSIYTARFSRTVTNTAPGFDYELEGLRGLGALLVFVSHVAGNTPNLLTGFVLPEMLLKVGHSVVLCFFVLSGYVIGLTNKHAFSGGHLATYLKRRTIRILPIYYCVVLGSMAILLLSRSQLGLGTLICHVTFLQGITCPSMPSNTPLWSLSYEVLYYLFFIAVWAFRPKIFALCAVLLFAITLLPIIGFSHSSFLGILVGFLFWLGGLIIAFKFKVTGKQKRPLVSFLLLFLFIHNLQPGAIFLTALNFNYLQAATVSMADLIQFFPFFILLISVSVGRGNHKLIQTLFWLSYGFSVCIGVIVMAMHGWKDDLLPEYCLLLFSLFLLNWKQPVGFLSLFSGFGKLSYAFYVVHWPILYLLAYALPVYGAVGFWVKVILGLTLSIVISFFLEVKLQPVISQKLISQPKLGLKTVN